MRQLTLNVFSLSVRCPVCGGSENSRYHGGPHLGPGGQMRHKCNDCGFTWDQLPTPRRF